MTLAGLGRALIRLAPLYAAVGAVFIAFSLVTTVHAGLFGYDFHGTTWEAGKHILTAAHRIPHRTPNAPQSGKPCGLPAPTLVASSPLALLPSGAAAALWDVFSLVALLAALRIVGVRDWRVYAIVLLSCPAFLSFKLAQLDSIQALGCALAWRWRRAPGRGLRSASDRRRVEAAPLAVARLAGGDSTLLSGRHRRSCCRATCWNNTMST